MKSRNTTTKSHNSSVVEKGKREIRQNLRRKYFGQCQNIIFWSAAIVLTIVHIELVSKVQVLSLKGTLKLSLVDGGMPHKIQGISNIHIFSRRWPVGGWFSSNHLLSPIKWHEIGSAYGYLHPKFNSVYDLSEATSNYRSMGFQPFTHTITKECPLGLVIKLELQRGNSSILSQDHIQSCWITYM